MLFFFSLALGLLLGAPGLRRSWRAVVLAALLYALGELLVMVPVWWEVPGLPGRYNWLGKLLVFLLGLAVVYGWRWVRPAEAGLQQPAPGSLRVVVPVLLVFALIEFVNGYLVRHRHPRPTAEALGYELLMPGLAEEMLYRGLVPGMLGRVFARRLPLPGTRTSWGGVVGGVLFVLAHGLSFAGPQALLPQVHISPETVVSIGAWGLVLLWMRERTGSVWVAMLAHNLANFCLYAGRWIP